MGVRKSVNSEMMSPAKCSVQESPHKLCVWVNEAFIVPILQKPQIYCITFLCLNYKFNRYPDNHSDLSDLQFSMTNLSGF